MPAVTILNAAVPRTPFDDAVHDIARLLGGAGRCFDLAEMDIHFCIGCWNCWWKTPGRCVFTDGMQSIYRSILASDVVLLATPTVAGLPGAVMKKTLDRSIPLVHPYVELHHGESHHRRRYRSYPDLALYADTKGHQEDFSRLQRWIGRYARNFHGNVVLTASETRPAREVAHALARA